VDRGAETLGDQLHRIVKPTHPYLAVGRRADRFEQVDEVVSEFVSERPDSRRCPKPDLTVGRVSTAVVLLPGLDPRLAVLLNREPPRCPTLTGVGASAGVEGQVGLDHAKLPRDDSHQLPSPIGLDGIPIAESGDEFVVAAERANSVLVPRDPLLRFRGSGLHGVGLSAAFILWAHDAK